jgi:cytochrome c oxidase assembly protein subunit 15
MAIGMTTETELTEAVPRGTAIGIWLLVAAVLVFALAVLGGVTRLEHAGLSITQWKPLAGILPPLSAEAWEAEFAHYRQFPEFQQVHQGMDLAGFQYIFWFEYTHRLLARIVGVFIALPLLFLWLTRRIDRQLALRILGVVVLIGLQGALGWAMVASGLDERPDVSHYLLTAHLGLAVLIFGALLWLAFTQLVIPGDEWGVPISAGFRYATYVAAGLVYLLVLSGALVAGLDAGFDYNTFPKMDGRWIPPGLFPDNPLDSVVTVQFLHRWYGLFLGAYVVLLWGRSLDVRLPDEVRAMYRWLMLAFALQGVVGIATVVLGVPVALGALHQAGALIVFGIAVGTAYTVNNARVRPQAGIHIIP